MTSKVKAPQRDDAIRLYTGGMTSKEVGREVKLSSVTVLNIIRGAGLPIHPQGIGNAKVRASARAAIAADAVSLYRSGVSEKGVSDRLDVSRGTVRKVLIAAGVDVRGQSAAEKLKWSGMDVEARARQVGAAHAAVLGQKRTAAELEKRARRMAGSTARVGAGESDMAAWLAARGVVGVPQLAVGKYNVDLACAPVAVEVHLTTTAPYTGPYFRKRIKDILDAGWHILYVWVGRGPALSESAADHAAAFIEQAKGDPTMRREYRVIRGSGQLAARGHLDLDHLTFEPTAECPL